ncbi:MAG: YtxH domain-containing protein [Eubacteriales bacterium]|jgi:gas vesicle protein|nr:YtxH domain-containing protein [Eubacteriales bacterium]
MNTGSFVKGIVTGAVIGMGISMLAVPTDERDRKRLAKKTSKVFTTLGAVADNIMDVVK